MASHKSGKGSGQRATSTRAGTQATGPRKPQSSGQSSAASAKSASVATDAAASRGAKVGAGGAARTTTSRDRAYRSKMNRYKRRRQLQTQLIGGGLVVVAIAALAYLLWPKPTPPSKASLAATATAQACTSNAQTGLSGTPAAAGGPPAVSGKLVTLPGCLKYIDVKVGTGQAVTADDVKNQVNVTADYTGWLVNGTKFDASSEHGGPQTFPLGQVIAGWNQGLVGMKVGGERRLIIPPALGYGAQASGPIPANSWLIFDVTLDKIG